MSVTKGSRKGIAAVAVAIGTVLALASAAFACGAWKGSFTVVGDASPDASVSHGLGVGMYRCDTSANSWGAKANNLDGIITVSTGTSDCGSKLDTSLAKNPYTINLLWWTPERELAFDDCMNATNTNVFNGFGNKVLGTVVVQEDGTLDGAIAGSGDSVPQSGDDNEVKLRLAGPEDTGVLGPGKSIVCISSADGHTNNQTEVQLI